MPATPRIAWWSTGPSSNPTRTTRATDSPTGAYPVLDVGRGDAPVIVDPEPPDTDLAVWLPEDIVALRRTDPDLARQWRVAQRAVLAPAFAKGYRATLVTGEGWLLLTRGSR